MNVVVATHGHCFDGLASAVLFTRLLERLERRTMTFTYRACGYGVGQPRPTDEMLSGEANAILDFRFSPTDSLTWYFDHHRTAFESPADREVFEQRRHNGRFFFDEAAPSCAGLIARVAGERFALEEPSLGALVRWATRIDAADFETAEQAVSRTDPVLQLATVVEHHGNDDLLKRLVRELLKRPLEEVARLPKVQKLFAPLDARQKKYAARVRDRCELVGRVVFVDLTEAVLETVGKFVTYALEPASTYSVIVGRLKNGVKISVGYNPWSGAPLDRDVSAICARYGGGGHRAVGGIAFPLQRIDEARRVARDIATELDT